MDVVGLFITSIMLSASVIIFYYNRDKILSRLNIHPAAWLEITDGPDAFVKGKKVGKKVNLSFTKKLLSDVILDM